MEAFKVKGDDSLNLEKVEKTFIMVKPDGVQRRLIGTIIQRLERKGLKLVAMKYVMGSPDLIRQTYIEEKDKPYFPLLMKIMTAGPLVPMIWKGVDAVGMGRRIVSDLVTELSLPGTIRGDYCIHVGRNAVHGADTKTEADYDINRWFPDYKD